MALTANQRKQLPTTKEIEEDRVTLGQERTQLDARQASFEELRDQQQKALEDAVEVRSGTELKLDVIRMMIAEHVALCPDDERPAREAALVRDLAEAEMGHQTAALSLSAIRETAPTAAEIERREMRCERLAQAMENQKTELMQLERDIGRLTGQIQAAGGDGVGESLAAAQEQRAMAERELACIQHRVATLQLLRDNVSACMHEGRERYYEPVRRHLRPFLNDLFPGAELELGDGFAITGIKRSQSETFARLSDGTQEQIAVLVRLAMGAMLAERGAGVPIILDDALVYCDDDRIKLMFDALNRAGRNQQIIVLTCRLRSFTPLGGRSLRVEMPPSSPLVLHA